MLDSKAITGTLLTAGFAGSTWVEQANEYGQLGLTVIGAMVGLATLYYTILRARKLRLELKKDRKEDE